MTGDSNIKVLTIDDEDIVRENIAAYLEDNNFTVFQGKNGKHGIEMFRKVRPDIVLLDLRMPEMDGIEVLKLIREESDEIPVIMISGTGVMNDAIEALRVGAWDYIIKPIQDMAVLEHALSKSLERAALLRENRLYREHLEEEIKKRTSEIVERTNEIELTNNLLKNEIVERRLVEERLKKTLHSLEETIDGIVNTIALIVEMRDPYTGGHQRHVSQLSKAIAMEMGLSGDQIQGIYIAGLLHDTGKIAVPIEILVKPGKINDIEEMMIRTHATAGWNILKEVEFMWPIAEIVLQHHERIDGSGYPKGLTGEYILKEAKIIGVADVIESMTFHRPYREALGIENALAEIETNRGTLYDTEVVDICVTLFRENRFSFQ
ncbi:MAG TPA: response regulator [Spirochaetota bacterium]|nr:response regulator [Spirochaetota bacterium]